MALVFIMTGYAHVREAVTVGVVGVLGGGWAGLARVAAYSRLRLQIAVGTLGCCNDNDTMVYVTIATTWDGALIPFRSTWQRKCCQ